MISRPSASTPVFLLTSRVATKSHRSGPSGFVRLAAASLTGRWSDQLVDWPVRRRSPDRGGASSFDGRSQVRVHELARLGRTVPDHDIAPGRAVRAGAGDVETASVGQRFAEPELGVDEVVLLARHVRCLRKYDDHGDLLLLKRNVPRSAERPSADILR